MGKEHLREQRPCTLWGAKPLLAILPLLYHCQELVTNTYGISYLTDYNTVIYSSQISPGSAFLPHYTCFYFAPKKKRNLLKTDIYCLRFSNGDSVVEVERLWGPAGRMR